MPTSSTARSAAIRLAALGLLIAAAAFLVSGGHLLFLPLLFVLPLGGLVGRRQRPTGPAMSARRLARGLSLAGLVAVLAAVSLGPAATPRGPAPAAIQLVRFGGGGFHFGGGGLSARRPSLLGRRPSTLGRRTTGRSRGILRSIGRALAVAAIFHFLFAGSGGGGFILLLLIVGLVVVLVRRRRRRAYPRY